MKRFNYRVLCYYKDNEYSLDSYMMLINAKNKDEIKKYFDCTDLDYEILNEVECFTADDVRRANSILIDNVRIYNDNKAYDSAVAVVAEIYDLIK